jgi:hypothetical protein
MTGKLYYNQQAMAMLFPYIELFASLFILLLCFQIFTRHYESKVARSFALFLLVAFLATIFEYSMRIAFTLEFARALNRISASLWVFAFSLFASFAFVFTRKKEFLEKAWAPFFFYVPPTLLSLLFIFTNIMYTRYEIWNIGIISQPSPWYWLFGSDCFLSIIGSHSFFPLCLYFSPSPGKGPINGYRGWVGDSAGSGGCYR